ncbi:MAG: helix-turn-helix domain-containing protein [Pseudonocardiaceae bacterium]
MKQYRKGASLRGLAELTDCSYSTVRRALLNNGVTVRSPGDEKRREDRSCARESLMS